MTKANYMVLLATFCLSVSSYAQKKVRVTVSGRIDGHTYVDLGLPSGTLWATCNVGSKNAAGFGNYFAWGEISQKEDYFWRSYEWGYKNIRKYCSNSQLGLADGKELLEPDDDAATANWGEHWCMPSRQQMSELMDMCSWQWTDDFSGTGVAGYIGVSKANEKIIFLPAAGFLGNRDLEYDGEAAFYWTNTRSEDDYGAHAIFFDNDEMHWKSNSRYCGLTVRAVSSKRR